MNHRSRERAPMAPMPADPMVCRWCSSRRKLVLGVFICPSGCSANETPNYLGHCSGCGRDYETGARWSEQCYECLSREMAEMVASYRDRPETRDYQRKEHQRRLAEKERDV